VIAFIDAHRDRFGVEPICRVLSEHGCGIAPNTYWVAKKRPLSARQVRDWELVVEIRRVFEENLFVYALTRCRPSSTGKGSESLAAPWNV
jgi:hypothetical protein